MANSRSTFLILVLTAIFMASSSTSLASDKTSLSLPASTISAAPALLPVASPPEALSPDITPLFPSPAGDSEISPSLPIIPSSPTPPNPDEMWALGPTMAFAPSGLLPESSSIGLSVMGFLMSSVVVSCVVAFGVI